MSEAPRDPPEPPSGVAGAGEKPVLTQLPASTFPLFLPHGLASQGREALHRTRLSN